MNFYFLSTILFIALITPVSFASAETINFYDTVEDGVTSPIATFVQIVHRDSDGNLLAIIQSDKMTDLNSVAINYYIDKEKTRGMTSQIFDFKGQLIEFISDEWKNGTDHDDITASTMIVIKMPSEENPGEFVDTLGARFAHDGLLLTPGDELTTVWYFARLL